MKKKFIAAALGSSVLSFAASVAQAGEHPALQIMRDTCTACHTVDNDRFSRISDQRKSPEGWLMTMSRMRTLHDVELSADEVRTVVKYLADTQGLAPSETVGVRYALERRLNTMEAFPSQDFTEMCARCHSGARVMLQRRPASEWEHLVHFHLGQWPTTEYQALARDRDWLPIALDQMVPWLAEHLPLESDAWKTWQERSPTEVTGRWSVAGNLPGKGEFHAVMTVEAGNGDDQYVVSLDGTHTDGTPMRGSGQALTYTGFEWRANLDVDGVGMRQVFALEGDTLRGRMFEREHDEIGADVVAAREVSSQSQVLAVQPAYLKVGEEAEIAIVGAGLSGDVQLPQGVTVLEVLEHSPMRMVVRARADASANGVHSVGVGNAEGGTLAVYDQIATVRVLPEFSVARVGGNGGSTPPVQGRFEAEAWAAGPDGVPDTDDDYRIGVVPATWSVAPFDEQADHDGDVRFAGQMDADSGIFMPAGAGPNPERRMSTNNAGNLNVIAEVADGDQTLNGQAQLIVTVQRWNNPPIP